IAIANRHTRPKSPPSPTSSESDVPAKKKRRVMESSTPTVTIPTRHSARSKNNGKLAGGLAQAAASASHRPSVSAMEYSNRGPPAKNGPKAGSAKGKPGPAGYAQAEAVPAPKKARQGQPSMENYA
ncbi:hypothetical protein GY45DRAFT_1339428, partial [Cubamyces sp. BRFM 1775]